MLQSIIFKNFKALLLEQVPVKTTAVACMRELRYEGLCACWPRRQAGRQTLIRGIQTGRTESA